MRSRNPEGPWNPAEPVEVTPEEYERQVVAWISAAREGLTDFDIRHRQKIEGDSDEYEFDAVATFSLFGRAEIMVLVECKRHRARVKRDVVVALHDKVRDVGAHKGMVFSASGFQKGAIKYADARGIATVVFRDGKGEYQTRWQGPAVDPPPWVPVHRFVGQSLSISESGGVGVSVVDDGRLDPIREFLAGT